MFVRRRLAPLFDDDLFALDLLCRVDLVGPPSAGSGEDEKHGKENAGPPFEERSNP
ncbi:hypothetical protein ABNG03_03230 [Halorubrum sp. RMP-47]|uniref:hypothetical protein n=1 Tax=Halorubrum miltondacostae TaxID=3076378 RepID=UPI0035291F3A